MRPASSSSSGKQRHGGATKRLGEYHGGSYGVYMAHKIQKLRNQNASLVGHNSSSSSTAGATHLSSPFTLSADANSSSIGNSVTPTAASSSASLFCGVHIYVDGYTSPSKEELRQLLLLHGGGFEHYETPRVTHIIATHLPASKVLQIKKMKKPTPVVHPDWIVQSLEQRRLLPVRPFLYQGFTDSTQSSLLGRTNILNLSASSSFSGAAPAATTAEVIASPHSTAAAPPLSPSSLPVTIDPQVFADTATAAEYEGTTPLSAFIPMRLEYPDTEELDDDDDDDDDTGRFSDSPSHSNSSDCLVDADIHAAGPAASFADSSSTSVLPGVQPRASTSVSGMNATSAFAPSPITRIHSTRDGPAAFVRHFFAKSRLHHIGNWRSTFQQRAREFVALYRGAPIVRAPATSTRRVLLHVDMDCFFVAVAVRGRRDLEHAAVAVAHSDTAAGSSEISSCNYLARAKGVRAGMFMRAAKTLCPNLVVLPYDFAAIERVSFQIYSIFFTHTPYVQAMSCDEAVLEFAADTNGAHCAAQIRAQIFAATHCRASVGVSYNILLAKLASKHAKPDGVCEIACPADAEPFLHELGVRDLPGVGRQLSAKLHDLGISDVRQLRAWPKSDLARHVGATTSAMLTGYARGVDERALNVNAALQRKSVSAVVNFGIRFECAADATAFLMVLADELAARLETLDVRAACLTLLLKKRRDGAPLEPSKFMGHGVCDNFAKTQVLAALTRDALVIGNVCCELLRQFHFAVADLRGVGIQATKLVGAASAAASGLAKANRARDLLTTWLSEPARDSERQAGAAIAESPANEHASDPNAAAAADHVDVVVGGSRDDTSAVQASTSISTSAPTTRELSLGLSQVNMSVLGELPSWIQDEVLSTYRPHRASSVTVTAATTKTMPAQHERSSGRGRMGLTAPSVAAAVPTRANGKQPLRRQQPRTGLGASITQRVPPSTRPTFTHVRDADSTRSTIGAASSAASAATSALNDIHMSQIDSDVYYALPFALRREIDRHAKRSSTVTSVAQAAAARARAAQSTQLATAATAAAAPVKPLQSIEDLFASVLATMRATATLVVSGNDNRQEPLLASQSEAFDAIYSRILIEVERRALDHALRMLRFVRRKCASAATATVTDDAGGDAALALLLRSGFNRVLELVNRDVQQHFRGVLAVAAVAPL